MMVNVNLNHPRMIKRKEDGTVVYEKLPLSTRVGNLLSPAIDEEFRYVQFD